MEVAVGCGGVGVGRSLKGRFLFPSFLPLTPDETLLSFATQSSMRENGVFIKTVEEREGGLGVGWEVYNRGRVEVLSWAARSMSLQPIRPATFLRDEEKM